MYGKKKKIAKAKVILLPFPAHFNPYVIFMNRSCVHVGRDVYIFYMH